MIPKHVIEAPAAVPYRHGLFSVVQPRPTELVEAGADPHWRNGITWASQSCTASAITQSACVTDDSEILSDMHSCNAPEFDPFTIYQYNEDLVPGFTLEQHERNAVDRLLASEQAAVEFHLWSEIGARIEGCYDLEEYPGWLGLGIAEQIAAGFYNGGVIHMSRVAAMALSLHLFPDGAIMRTRFGTPVVVGAGYDFFAASPATASIAVTGQLVMYRGEITTTPRIIDKANNKVSVIAARDYAIGFDCAPACLTVNICTPPDCSVPEPD